MTYPLPIARPILWPPNSIGNELGTATISLGSWKHHKLANRLEIAAKVGFKSIDLFDECWAAYLEEHGLDGDKLWDPTPDNLRVARKLGNLVKSLGMQIICTQPLRKIEGIKDPAERRAALNLVAKRFPFMRAFDTDLVFMCANVRTDSGVTSDYLVVSKDLAELGDMAAAYAKTDGGRMLKIGYEGLSWATRNTWSASWEVVRTANRPNVGFVIDAFHILAIEYADPYNPAGHGLACAKVEDSVRRLCLSLAELTVSVPADKIFFYQCADGELMDPQTFHPPTDPEIHRYIPWARGHRLYPLESLEGAYLPTELVTAAVLATGYSGPISVEVFHHSLYRADSNVPLDHAKRGMIGLKKLVAAAQRIPAFWDVTQSVSVETLVKLMQSVR